MNWGEISVEKPEYIEMARNSSDVVRVADSQVPVKRCEQRVTLNSGS